jgi:hypothetical protein
MCLICSESTAILTEFTIITHYNSKQTKKKKKEGRDKQYVVVLSRGKGAASEKDLGFF